MPASCSARTMSLHLGNRPFGRARGRVLGVRREEAQRHVPPVVPLLGIALVDGQQFHHGDAEIQQVRDLVDDAGERPAVIGGTPELSRLVNPRTCIS